MSGIRLASALCAAVALASMASHALAANTPIVTAGAGSGSERCVTGGASGVCGGNSGSKYLGLTPIAQLYAQSQGATLQRVGDNDDTIWKAQSGAGVFAIGRSASNSFTLGYIPGASGPIPASGVVNPNYQMLLGTIGSSSNPTLDLPSDFIAALDGADKVPGDIQTGATPGMGLYNASGDTPDFLPISIAGQFRFAINGVSTTRLWSSLPADNAPFESGQSQHDHMVTWELFSPTLTALHETEYVASFENAAFTGGGDGDFNDYTFVFLNVTPAPEPAAWALMIAGLGVMGAGLRMRRKPLPAAA